MTATSSPTRVAPPRPPDGFGFGHPRYRGYLLFGATGLFLVIDALIVLRAAQALGEGPVAWASFLAAFATPVGLVASVVLVGITLYFSIRWLRVGVKVATVRIGFMPAAPTPAVLVGHYVALVALTGLVLLLLGGIIL
jgi:fumarate reductase subunit C